jgi:multidrug efflux system membrane fusion protein
VWAPVAEKPKHGNLLGWSIVGAFGLSFATVFWFSQGMLVAPPSASPPAASTTATQLAKPAPLANTAVGSNAGDGKLATLSGGSGGPFPVTVQTSTAVERQQIFTIRGQTEASARVSIKAETAGVVEEIGATKGAQVQKGELLCALAPGARQAGLAEAQAQLAKAQQEFAGNTQLADRGFASKNSTAGIRAQLDAAEAAVKKAEIELNRTRITAPFSGRIEEQPAKPGEFLSIGSPCAVVLAPDPLYVVGAVAERDVGRLKQGMEGTAKLVTGETVAGSISFVASAAEASTRTFRVELKVPNGEGSLRDGVTATMQIPLSGDAAHMLAPSALILSDAGELGVRIVGEGDTARFMPVKVLGDERANVWVSGLPKQVKVIVAGQDYVADGQEVGAVERSPAARQ